MNKYTLVDGTLAEGNGSDGYIIPCACGLTDCFKAVEVMVDGDFIYHPDLSEYRAGLPNGSEIFVLPDGLGIFQIEEVPGLPAPNEPGWWAFEGFHASDRKCLIFRSFYFVIVKDGKILLQAFDHPRPLEADTLRLFNGTWWKVEFPKRKG